jgi:hypothetical protein
MARGQSKNAWRVQKCEAIVADTPYKRQCRLPRARSVSAGGAAGEDVEQPLEIRMHKLSSVILLAAVLGVGVAHAQTAPAPAPARTVKAVQPGLLEVTGPRVNEAVAAGIQKINAVPGKGRRSIEVVSPWGNVFFDWPKGVKPVAFSIEHAKKADTVTVSAPGFTDANKGDYKAAVDAIVPMAIAKAQDQKTTKSMKP